MSQLEPDRNLLCGVIAMQIGLIEKHQFAEACMLWGSRSDTSLAEVLVEQGWLLAEDWEHVRYILKRRLQKARSGTWSPSTEMRDDDRVGQVISAQECASEVSGIVGEAERFTPSEATVPGPQFEDRIVRAELYSSGGVGNIWKAHDRVLGRDIAIKELQADHAGGESNRRRFLREAQITAQLTHPGVVSVHDLVEAAGRCYYVMQFVDGQSLAEVIKVYHEAARTGQKRGLARRRLELINYFLSVCNTIAFAHSRRVIHRDLKPDNIMVGRFGEVLVLDWGLAKRLEGEGASAERVDATLKLLGPGVQSLSGTVQGQKLGTPLYMSPEQARGENELSDERTDVYGLAAILYEILTGQPPFSGDDVAGVLERVIHDPARPPSELADNVPPEIERICLRGLSKKRDERQQTAAELADEVQSWLAERTQQTFQEFLESAPDAMLVTDDLGTIVRVNTLMERLFGYGRDELVGNPVECLLPERFRTAHVRHVAAFAATPTLRPMTSGFEVCGRKKDGSEFPADVSLSPIETEQGLLISCAIRELAHGCGRKTGEQGRKPETSVA